MAIKHLCTDPVDLIPEQQSTLLKVEGWHYETPEGLCVVLALHEGDGTIITALGRYCIPWRYLRQAVQRRDRRKGRKR